MNKLNSEIEPKMAPRKPDLFSLLILIIGFSLLWCFGFLMGKAIKGRFMDDSACTRGYSGTPCKPDRGTTR